MIPLTWRLCQIGFCESGPRSGAATCDAIRTIIALPNFSETPNNYYKNMKSPIMREMIENNNMKSSK